MAEASSDCLRFYTVYDDNSLTLCPVQQNSGAPAESAEVVGHVESLQLGPGGGIAA